MRKKELEERVEQLDTDVRRLTAANTRLAADKQACGAGQTWSTGEREEAGRYADFVRAFLAARLLPPSMLLSVADGSVDYSAAMAARGGEGTAGTGPAVRPLPASVRSKLGAGLHMARDHPLGITSGMVLAYFVSTGRGFVSFDGLDPEVSVQDNFDSLLVPQDHPARSESDTFYVGSGRVLRTHMTAHQVPLLLSGRREFLATGAVYRRDEVDRTHYPVFHQAEGVCRAVTADPAAELRCLMCGLLAHLFPGLPSRVQPDEFPFTTESMQAEVFHDGTWLEVLGCGLVHPDIRRAAGCDTPLLAWGIGLERLAMLLFRIPDIRLFWSRERAFLTQFRAGRVNAYVPFSTLAPVTRDISFWVPDGWARVNEFLELARESAPELVQEVGLWAEYRHPKNGQQSRTFRVTFAPVAAMRDGACLNEQANSAMAGLADAVQRRLDVVLR